MRTLKLALLPAALSAFALLQVAPAQACARGCDGDTPRACLWDEACVARRLEARFSPAAWQMRAPQAFMRTVTRFDVEAVRLFQRMP